MSKLVNVRSSSRRPFILLAFRAGLAAELRVSLEKFSVRFPRFSFWKE